MAMAAYAGLVAGVPHMGDCSAGAHIAPRSWCLDTQNVSRAPSATYALHSSCGITASLLKWRTPSASSTLKCRKTNGQLLRSSSSLCGVKLILPQSCPPGLHRKSFVVQAQVTELASGVEVINNLGLDTLTFLGATVLIVPTFKAIKQSPILGFLLAGVVLNQLGLIRSVTDVKALAELGILFLLFEMGLELSLARLKALAKFAFGIGLAQVVLSTLAFTAFELPPNKALGTQILEFLFHARPDLVNIRSVDEAVVIGAALSLSSSAFVLQLLAEKGELPTRFGSATLGILLLQDIAVVPLLVILPILETGNIADQDLWPVFASESLKALLGLGLISLGGRLFLRRLFEIVANSRSSEAFVAMCLLTVSGTSLLTQRLGFSDTLGAFLAGALLAETNYRTQVEADIRPFRGLLLGLFFVTTGTSIDIQLLLREWPHVLALLAGLIAIKTAIITALGPRAGLTLSESVRTGLLLSQGGEFAFVVFSLANRLGVLPLELNRLLIIVVVLSMALTPLLNEVGREVAEYIQREYEDPLSNDSESKNEKNFQVNDPVVVIGFGPMGQVLANFLSTPLAAGLGGDAAGWPYVAFDLDPGRVKAACKLGFPVLYGDGSRPVVLQTAGISQPKAVMVMYTGRQKSVQSVDRLRQAFPQVPIYARAQDLEHLFELKQAGITDCILENAETSLQLGSVLLRGLGVMSDDVRFLRRMMRESIELRAQDTVEKKGNKEIDWLMTFQSKVRKTWKNRTLRDDSVTRKVDLLNEQAYWGDGKSSPSTDAFSIEKEERKLDDKLPLFAKNKYPASKVRVSTTGILNGALTISDDEGVMSSSAIAVASPSGMLLEQAQQTGTAASSVPEAEVQPSAKPIGGESPPAVVEKPEPSPDQPASREMAKLKWVRRKAEDYLDDERGVTLCALEEDERYRSELEEGEEREKLDETILALKKREESKKL